jgi:hypothetical protein
MSLKSANTGLRVQITALQDLRIVLLKLKQVKKVTVKGSMGLDGGESYLACE